MLKAIIIDDDYFSRKLIIEHIICYFPELCIAAEADSVDSGMKAICEHNPNLVFLDIELPDGKGFDIFNYLKPIPFKVIFTTGHKDYAYDAFKCSAVDYLVKPISKYDLIKAVQKAISSIPMENLPTLNASITQCSDKIIIKTSESIYFIQKENIIRCEAYKNYTTIHQSNEKSILASRTLKDFEAILTPPDFIRVHQSHLVNVNFIKRIEKQESRIQLFDNSFVPIACRKHELLMDYVNTIPAL